MGEKKAEVISLMVLHGDVTEPARLTECEARTVVFHGPRTVSAS